MRFPSRAEIQAWDRVLARDGLPSDEALKHYTFRGGRDEDDGSNRHGAHVGWDGDSRSGFAFIRATGERGRGLSSSPRYQFWALAATHAARLPRNYRGRRVILAIARTGNIRGSALSNGLSWWSGRSLWRRFIRACGLPDTQAGSIGRPHRSQRPKHERRTSAEKPAPARSLTKREIAALNLEPPRAHR